MRKILLVASIILIIVLWNLFSVTSFSWLFHSFFSGLKTGIIITLIVIGFLYLKKK